MGNYTSVIQCRRCDRRADLIIDGFYLCSSHGLIIVLEQLEARTAAAAH